MSGEIDAPVVTERQRSLVENAQKQLPEASEAFSISSKSTSDSFTISECERSRFSCVSIGEVSRCPGSLEVSDQLGDLMRVLKFSAIDLGHQIRIAKENLRSRLNDTCLARARRTQEEQRANRLTGRRQSGEVNLVEPGNPPHSTLCPTMRRQLIFKVLRL